MFSVNATVARLGAAALGLGLATLAAAPARADLIVTVQSTVAAAGSTGNWFDVTLKNDGDADVDLNGFSFGLEAVSPDVVFTGVTYDTSDPYVFAGHSTFAIGSNIELWAGADVLAADAYDPADESITLISGATVGLGRVFFDLDAGASGAYELKLSLFPDASLSLGVADVPIDVLVDGTITVANDPVVPEPSSILMGVVAAAAGLAAALRRRAA